MITLGELARRGELEIGEGVELGGGLEVVRFNYPESPSGVHGLYYVAQGPYTYLHSDGQWRVGTKRPGKFTAFGRGDYSGYFDDLPTLIDHLFVATC